MGIFAPYKVKSNELKFYFEIRRESRNFFEKLLTTGNPEADKDRMLFEKLGIQPERRHDVSDEAVTEAIAAQAKAQNEAKFFYDATV